MKPDTPLRVLSLLDTYRVNGPANVVFGACERALEYGLDTSIACFLRGDMARTELTDDTRRRGITLHTVRERFRFDPRTLTELLTHLNTHPVDVLETHGHKANVCGALLRRRLPCAWISFAHGWTDENWKIRLYNLTDAWAMRHPDRVAAVSDGLRRKIVERGVPISKTTVIHNAASPHPRTSPAQLAQLRNELGVDDGSRTVAVIGRFSPEKGQEYLLRSLPNVLKCMPQVRVFLVGEGQEEAMLRQLTDELRLHDNVCFTGFRSDVSAFYDLVDLVVLPSLSEGLPMVALEAMMARKPVVASAVGGVPEVVHHERTGILVPPADEARLADAVCRILADTGERRRLGQAAHRFVNAQFSHARRMERLTSLYREVLARPRRRTIPQLPTSAAA